MKTKLLTAVISTLLAFTSHNAAAVGLAEVLENARKNDPSYKSAIAGLSASQYEKWIGRAGLLPSLSASFQQGKATYDRDQLNNQGQVITSDSQKVDVESSSIILRQTLFNVDAWSRNKIGENLAEVGELQFRKLENEFLLKSITAYINVLRQLDIRNATAAEFEAMKGLVTLTESQVKGGEANRLNILDAIAKRDIAQAFAVEAEENLESTVRILEAVCGLKIYSISTLPEKENLDLTPGKPISYFREIALQSNPDIGMAKKQIEINRHEIDKAAAGHYPRLDLVLSQNSSENDSVNNLNLRSDNRTAVIQLQMPLFSGYGVEGQRRKSVQLLEKSKADFETVAQQVMVDLRKHYSAASLSNQKAKAFERAVASSLEVSKANEIGLRAGLTVEYDALNARQMLTKAQLELSKVKYDAIESALKIRATVGLIDEATIQALSNTLKADQSAVPLNRIEDPKDEPIIGQPSEPSVPQPEQPVADVKPHNQPVQNPLDMAVSISTSPTRGIITIEEALELSEKSRQSKELEEKEKSNGIFGFFTWLQLN